MPWKIVTVFGGSTVTSRKAELRYCGLMRVVSQGGSNLLAH